MAINAQTLLFVLQWKPVPGFEGFYEVSNGGQVRSLDRQTKAGLRKGRILQAAISSSGYLLVTLTKPGVRQSHHVHVLVCRGFHGERPTTKHQAAHEDGDKINCRSANVCWKTKKENEADKIMHGTRMRGDKHHQTKIPDALIDTIRQEYVKGSPTHGLKALAGKYGVSLQPIHSIVTGERYRGA